MRVSLIKPNKIQNIILPNKIEGSFWVTDNDSNDMNQNLISIEAYNNQWKIVSNSDVFCVQNGQKMDSFIIEDYHFYSLHNRLNNSNLLIYCSPVETKYDYYDISAIISSEISIGNQGTTVIYNVLGVKEAFVRVERDKLYIYDNGSKYGIYVNNSRVIGKKEIKIGDVIFICGLKLIFISKISFDNSKHIYLCVNKLNGVSVNNLPQGSIVSPDSDNFVESNEEIEFPLYSESEYFHKMPRFVSEIKPLVLVVDAPPTKKEENKTPAILTVGPMLTMSMASLITGYVSIQGVMAGTSTWSNATPSLVICFAMLGSAIVWPLLTRKYQNRSIKKEEKIRQEKYSEYIDSKRKEIENAIIEQSEILKNNFPTTEQCADAIIHKYSSLWLKRKEDSDYLEVSLGVGNCPMQININYPEEHFSLEKDNLKDEMSKLGKESKLLTEVPITLSLVKDYLLGVIGDSILTSEYIRRLLIQILASHSYDNLKIVVLTDEDNEYQWEFLKDCPHLFSNDKSIRFFASNSDEYKEICYYLDRVVSSRISKESSLSKPEIKETYLIITDSFRKIRDFDAIKKIIESKESIGFCTIISDKKMSNLPEQCEKFIQITDGHGELNDSNNFNNNVKFSIDLITPIDYDACIKSLANIPIDIANENEGQIPEKIGFLEMYDVGKVEQLNSLVRWKKSNPVLNLQAPIGIGKNGEKINLDLHEKYHGPHGLVAGMTGSGKSELLITYILSMAVNYSPYEVQFILIDYKGGGLAGAFENKATGLKLPHLVGTITNLDSNEIKRSLASIESELKRRQALFNKAREISGESTVDIYKYQKMYRNGIVSEPVSHLFIISDEFAELKNQQPEFMEQLISTARIGRSLGVHLILATQKPSGVVDPQIWSNTRFRICMRVQEKSDSNEVIKCPDAAFLKQTGRFYFQVGYNEIFTLGQAAWAGGKYYPSEKVKKTMDTSIDFIDNVGYPYKNIDTKPKVQEVKSSGEELINIVTYLSSLANQENIHCKSLWLNKIPGFIKVDELSKKYNYQKQDYIVNTIVGEYDIPNNQEQKLLTIPLSKKGNAIVYGVAGSGKENFITTMIYSSMLYYSPSELNYYIIDFGSEALKMFKSSPLVGDIVGVDDKEKITNLYKMLNTLIEERKKLFSDYNGDYYSYCKNSGKSVPSIVVIINNFEAYQETYPGFEDILNTLTREGSKFGIYFVLAANTTNGIRFKLKQNFSLFYVLQQNNEDDYSNVLGNVHKTYPTKIFGRGLIKDDDIYEFQTALVTEKDKIPSYIKNLCTEYLSKYNIHAQKIPTLPETVSYIDIKNELNKDNKLIIGINKDDLSITKYDFDKNYSSIISAVDIAQISKFINPFINQIIACNRYKLMVINGSNIDINEKYQKLYDYNQGNFDICFENLLKYLDSSNDNLSSKREMCIILGFVDFRSHLSETNKAKISELFKKGKISNKITFIIADSSDNIRKLELDDWYKEYINGNNGIWLGNGFNDQFSLKMVQRNEHIREVIPDNFCFVINRGLASYVKYLESLELNIK